MIRAPPRTPMLLMTELFDKYVNRIRNYSTLLRHPWVMSITLSRKVMSFNRNVVFKSSKTHGLRTCENVLACSAPIFCKFLKQRKTDFSTLEEDCCRGSRPDLLRYRCNRRERVYHIIWTYEHARREGILFPHCPTASLGMVMLKINFLLIPILGSFMA